MLARRKKENYWYIIQKLLEYQLMNTNKINYIRNFDNTSLFSHSGHSV